MPTLIAVLKDLWSFCFGRTYFDNPKLAVNEDTSKSTFQAQDYQKQLLTRERVDETNFKHESFSTYGEKAYIVSDTAAVFKRPVWSYDGVFEKLKFSTSVQLLGYEGRFARISVEDMFGFVLKDELTTNSADIFPTWQTGEIYSSNHPDTKKLRKIIDDEFFATEMFLPLQDAEFVMYRLGGEGRRILWPDVRPRLSGSWQNILKGRIGVQIGVLPKTGAVIEYNKPDGTGFVGFTKSVHVDESIVIEGIGRLIEGEYREEAISKEEWHEWRPIWIAVM